MYILLSVASISIFHAYHPYASILAYVVSLLCEMAFMHLVSHESSLPSHAQMHSSCDVELLAFFSWNRDPHNMAFCRWLYVCINWFCLHNEFENISISDLLFLTIDLYAVARKLWALFLIFFSFSQGFSLIAKEHVRCFHCSHGILGNYRWLLAARVVHHLQWTELLNSSHVDYVIHLSGSNLYLPPPDDHVYNDDDDDIDDEPYTLYALCILCSV